MEFLKGLAVDTTIKINSSDLGSAGGGPAGFSQAQVDGILNVVYMLAGIVAVLVIIVGGIRYTASNGDSSQIQSAKNTILYGVVGLVIVIAAVAITNFVIQNITK